MRRQVIHALRWSAARTAGQTLVTVLVFLTLVRLLDPRSFGLIAMATVFTELILMFQDQGFDQAIVQRADLDDAHLDTAFWVSLATGGGMTLVTIALAGPISALFGEPELKAIITWLSLGFLFVSLGSIPHALLRRSLKMKQLALRSLAATVISGGVAIGMAFSGFGVWSLVARGLLASLVESLAVWWVSDWRPRFRFQWDRFLELFGFGAFIVGKRVITLINHRCDAFLIGFFLGPTRLGYYTVAFKLILMLKDLLTGVTGPVALPAFSRLQQDPERLQRGFFEATRLTSVIAFPVFLGVAVVGPELVPALYGMQWAPSIPVLQILALVGLLQTIAYYHTSVLVALGKPSWNFAIKFVGMVCNIVVVGIAVPWGITAVAAALLISNYVIAPVSLIAVQHCIRMDICSYLRQLGTPMAATAVMVLAVAAFRQFPLPLSGIYGPLLVLVGVGALTYALVLQIASPALTAQFLELFLSIRPRPKQI